MLSLSTPDRIEVFTRWVGFADPPSHSAKIIISRDGIRFNREVFPGTRVDELPADRVEKLLAALMLPPAPKLDPALFESSAAVILSHYGSIWTDDSPSHLVRLSFTDGRIITARTDSQHALMLPFQVRDSRSDLELETFNPRLSRAISELMPDGYLEKDRLAGRLGMLEWESDRQNDDGNETADEPEIVPPLAKVSETPKSPDEMETAFDEIFRILSGEESPTEKAEAEAAGRTSERQLKPTSPEDVQELLANGANPSIADDVGQTALMHAAWPPFDREKFRMLVKAGADLEARRNDGYTGLQLACAGGESEAASEWVLAGADIHARTQEGGATPLMLAATWCDIVRLLLQAGAEVNAIDQDGHSALVYAIVKQSWIQAERQLEGMQVLIDSGADVNCRDREGVTPLEHARRVLSRTLLEEETLLAFNPDADLSLGGDWNDRRMSEAVLNLVVSAGGKE